MLKVVDKYKWKSAIGASAKAKRLHLKLNCDGVYVCPVDSCENDCFKTKRGCRQHVFKRHGWYYFFDMKPDIRKVFPELNTRLSKFTLPKRCKTSTMPMFSKNCKIGMEFTRWITSPGGGGKSNSQADQILSRILKYFKYCCSDVSETWDFPETVADYCLGCVELLSDFVEYLRSEWKMRHSGIIGYLNSIGHIVDHRRSKFVSNNSTFVPTEIYMQRVKRYLTRKMKFEMNILLSIDHLRSENCWATLHDLQRVVPFHENRYKQIMINAKIDAQSLKPHDLSFCTAYIISILFLVVKPSRPMTFRYLTVSMLKTVSHTGVINQTIFKTCEKYGFDSLLFSKETLFLLNEYICFIRPLLHPKCDYLLLCRNGGQLKNISSILGRMVYQAIGKYINPTRYRQIVETESACNLSPSQQAVLSEDQKHSSRVAKIHYQKQKSEDTAFKALECMEKLKLVSKQSSADQNVYISETKNNTTVEDFSIVRASENNSSTKVNIRQKKTPFSSIEDDFLLQGIKKYGYGKWTSILNDPMFKFSATRKTSTLAVRARQKQFRK